MKPLLPRALIAALLAIAAPALFAQTPILIEKDFTPGAMPPVKINISGLTGEAASVLEFNLYVQGFLNVPADQAHFLIAGSNNPDVRGTVTDRVTRQIRLNKAYSGGSVRRQTHAFADDIVLALTGVRGIAQTRIAFKVTTGSASEVFVADFDGHNARAVTRDGSIVAAPAWAPGQMAIAYTSYRLGSPDIFRHELGSGARAPLARHPGLNTSVAFSPDGSKIAMILSKDGSPDVYVANADGSNPRRLTTTREAESSPCWSPDGQWICFVSASRGIRGLYKIPAAGGATQRIPTRGVSNPSEPDWSPDGRWIAFTAQMGGFEICVVPAEGGAATVLVSGEDPSWAPNSRTLIITRRSGGSDRLSLLDVPTKQVKDAVRISGSSSQPSWAR